MLRSPGSIRLPFLSVVLMLSVLGGSTLGACTFGASRGVDDGGGVTEVCSCICWSAGGCTVGLAAGAVCVPLGACSCTGCEPELCTVWLASVLVLVPVVWVDCVCWLPWPLVVPVCPVWPIGLVREYGG